MFSSKQVKCNGVDLFNQPVQRVSLDHQTEVLINRQIARRVITIGFDTFNKNFEDFFETAASSGMSS